jgi:hypothetical protein
VSEPAPKSHAKAAAADFLKKVDGALERVDSIRSEREVARTVAQQSQVREAITRSELTLALNEALIGRAEAQAHWRAESLRRYLAERQPAPLPPRGRYAERIERMLRGLGSAGQALLIERSGLWRGTGRRLHDLRHMAAYARRGANSSLQPPTLFDHAGYIDLYADVRDAGASPLAHYLTAGAAEDRTPHPLFDVAYYRRENAEELAATRLSPFGHYVLSGAARARNPHPLFDIAHYAGQATDMGPDENPLSHYLAEGWRRGYSPHPLFDPAWYRRNAPRSARETPLLLHYLTTGSAKGVSPHPLFDPAWYLAENPDVAQAGLEPLVHFVTQGGKEGRSPSPWFDLPWYVAARGEALPASANPLIDYLQGGAWAVVEARPGFPTAAYLASSPELVRQGLTPLEHWARRHAR